MHIVLERARVPLYFSRYSKHTYTVWQHVTLLAIRQYEFKSYRRFDEWINEAGGLVKFLKLSKIPHFTALNKFALRISSKLLEWILARFITLTNARKLFIGIDASGFKPGHASQYFFERMRGGVKNVKGYVKLSIGVEVREQLICSLKIRRSPKHDTVDFKNVISKSAAIKQLSIVVADKGYDSEGNHEFVRELDALSIIPTKFPNVPIERMHGRYRKEMKRCFYNLCNLYNQRNKNETVLSVIKRMFGEYITSRRVGAQNRELTFRCIAYNMHRCERIIFVMAIGFLHGQELQEMR